MRSCPKCSTFFSYYLWYNKIIFQFEHKPQHSTEKRNRKSTSVQVRTTNPPSKMQIPQTRGFSLPQSRFKVEKHETVNYEHIKATRILSNLGLLPTVRKREHLNFEVATFLCMFIAVYKDL